MDEEHTSKEKTHQETIQEMAQLWNSYGLDSAVFLMATPSIADEIKKIQKVENEE